MLLDIRLFLILFSVGYSIDPEHYFVLLSTPGQASTLLSYVLAVLPQLHCPACVLQSCDGVHEALNPRCHGDCENDWIDNVALGRCMGSQGYPFSSNIWLSECTSTDWQALTDTITKHGITFFKDVFSPSKLPLLVQSGFQVLVAFKPAWVTFPTAVSDMYNDIHDEYCLSTQNLTSPNQSLHYRPVAYPTLAHLLASLSCFPEALRDRLKSGMVRRKPYFMSHPPPCYLCRDVLGHYIAHFHLFMSARVHGVPVLDTSLLLTLDGPALKKFLIKTLPPTLFRIAAHMHNDTTASKSSSSSYRNRKPSKSSRNRRSHSTPSMKQRVEDVTSYGHDAERVIDSMVNRTLWLRSTTLVRPHSSPSILDNVKRHSDASSTSSASSSLRGGGKKGMGSGERGDGRVRKGEDDNLAISLSERLFAAKKKLFSSSGCSSCLFRLSKACDIEVKGCSQFNRMYGIYDYYSLSK